MNHQLSGEIVIEAQDVVAIPAHVTKTEIVVVIDEDNPQGDAAHQPGGLQENLSRDHDHLNQQRSLEAVEEGGTDDLEAPPIGNNTMGDVMVAVGPLPSKTLPLTSSQANLSTG